MTTQAKLTKADLARFTGSETLYRHPINPRILFTEGAQFVAERSGAYWLLNEIATIQPYDKAIAAQKFQVWTLVVAADRSAALTCGDRDDHIVFTKKLSFTDFPLDEITLWFANNTIYLPREH